MKKFNIVQKGKGMISKQTILIVDDTAENIDILSNIVKNEYRVKVAINGKSALKAVQSSTKPDLILLDVMMPDMDGYEVCKILKDDPSTAKIPIIFITALDDNANEEKGLSLGAVDYISKPINPAITLRRIKTHLALYDQNRELEIKVEEETEKRMQQQKLLVRQSRLAAMGEMMSAITHQWNQPLSAISASNDAIYMQLQMDNTKVDKILQYSGYIKDSVLFMRDTMFDFKNYFSTNKIHDVFIIDHEIDIVLKMLSMQLKNFNIEIKTDYEEHVHGYGVKSEFKHIILNLISNAKDAINGSAKETKEIKISTKQVDDTHSQIIIEDSGGGIPDDIIEKIYDDYFTTKDDKGTGIGLSMTKMIIEDEMKGSITVSNSDLGARFVVTIPSIKLD
jgi:CheY-like chemotaxis protein